MSSEPKWEIRRDEQGEPVEALLDGVPVVNRGSERFKEATLALIRQAQRETEQAIIADMREGIDSEAPPAWAVRRIDRIERGDHWRGSAERDEERRVKMIVDCYDCGEPYGSPRFQDLIIPLDIWERISPTSDEGGLLCPNCICARLSAAGISDCPAAFFSGPIRTVDRVTMEAYRRAENAWRRLVAEEGE